MKYFLLISVLTLLTVSFNAQTDPALRAELLKMVEADQKARLECAKGAADEQMKCLIETLEKIDKPNTARPNEIFNRTGFPTFQTVGKEGVDAFLILLQHASDENLRQKCRKPIKKAFRRKEIPPQDYANFIDRLLVH